MNTRLILSGMLVCTTFYSMSEIASAKFIRMICETGSVLNTTVGNGMIGEYQQTDNQLATPVSPNLVTGLSGPPSGPIQSSDLAGIAVMAVSSNLFDLFVANIGTNTIGEYMISNGTETPVRTIMGALTGLSHPVGIALGEGNFSDDLFVVNRLNKKGASVSEYNAITGKTVNANLISGGNSGLEDPIGIVFAAGDLFVANHKQGTIAEYNPSNGNRVATISTKAKGFNNLEGIAADEKTGNLFFVDQKGTVDEYSSGMLTTVVKTGLKNPIGIAVSDLPLPQGGFETDLFVVNNTGGKKSGTGTIAEYNAATGMLISQIPNLNAPTGIAIVSESVSVPETSSTCQLLLLGLALLLGLKCRLNRPV